MADQDRERWVKLVADFELSDLSQREFASERGISFSNLRYWLYRLELHWSLSPTPGVVVSVRLPIAPAFRHYTMKSAS